MSSCHQYYRSTCKLQPGCAIPLQLSQSRLLLTFTNIYDSHVSRKVYFLIISCHMSSEKPSITTSFISKRISPFFLFDQCSSRIPLVLCKNQSTTKFTETVKSAMHAAGIRGTIALVKSYFANCIKLAVSLTIVPQSAVGG